MRMHFPRPENSMSVGVENCEFLLKFEYDAYRPV